MSHARTGLVTIIRTADRSSYGIAGQWQPIPPGVIARPDPLETESEPYHVPADF